MQIWPSKRPQTEKLPTNPKVNHQTLIIFEGFRPNGLQIRNQRIFLHRIAPVKHYFDDFWTKMINVETLNLKNSFKLNFSDFGSMKQRFLKSRNYKQIRKITEMHTNRQHQFWPMLAYVKNTLISNLKPVWPETFKHN